MQLCSDMRSTIKFYVLLFQDDETPLHVAASRGHVNVCRLLITEGNADVNATSLVTGVNINFKFHSKRLFGIGVVFLFS